MKKMFQTLKKSMSLVLAVVMMLSMSSGLASSISGDGRYFADYNSYESALQAAAEITEEVAAEGEILLKNENNALPMLTKGRVTVFGISQVNVIGAGSGNNFSSGTGGMSIGDALEAAGFVVNERITDAYKVINSTERGNEKPGLELFKGNTYYEQSYSNHRDAAFIIISRDCAEGADKSVNTGELSAADAAEFDAAKTYAPGDVCVKDGIAYKFIADHTGEWNDADASKAYSQMKHVAPTTIDGVAYKHELQFSDSEEELIQYVESQNFKRIILLMNTSNNFEMADAQEDEKINAILWLGRPGVNGLTSFGKIMAGEINPSGRTVDLFFADFTKDPTWQNLIQNAQTGSSSTYATADGQFTAKGVEYEEDIYLGYRYAETAANEADFAGFDYDTDVVYPFGYGLSYSSFAFNSMELYAVENGEEIALKDVADIESKLASSEGSIAAIKQLVAKVEVENTGSKAGKQVVEIFVNAPYTDAAASTQKAYVVLAGFGKTEILQPGEKQIVTVALNVQDFASYDAANLLGVGAGYTLEAGEYRVMALSDSHAWDAEYVASGKGFGVQDSFTLSNHVLLGLDDFTNNPTRNLFSVENGMFYTIRDNANASAELTGDWGVDTAAFNANDNDPMTLMVRGQFAGTQPVAPTADALLISDNFANMYNYWFDYVLDGVKDTDGSIVVDPAAYADAEVTGADGKYVEKTNLPWLKNVNNFMDTDRYAAMTQAAETGTQLCSLSKLSGIDPLGQEVLTEADTDVEAFQGKTGQEAWDLFLNSLTWNQLVDVVTMQATNAATVPGGSYLDYGIEGNGSMSGVDSPLNLNGTYQFADNPSLAASFNAELATRQGEIIGNIALVNGYNRWWGPTVNLHRSPFSGRAHEYFSSDPFLTGSMSYLECAGAQSRGLACCPKHAILNEQETDRGGLMTFASEQAIRELYAKPLQMLLQEGEGLGVMGAMNRIGSLHNYGNYNFITGLLHDEWDMRGSYTTDMGGSHGTMNPELMVRAGLNDVNNGKSYFSVGAWDASLRNGLGGVMVAVGTDYERESLAQWYSTRTSATWVLFMHANCAMNHNGYDPTEWSTVALNDAQQGSAYVGSVAIPASIDAANAVYSISGLPAGLTLNVNSGEITGVPTVYGDYDISVKARLDSWIDITAASKLTIAPAFRLDVLVAGETYEAENNVIEAYTDDDITIDMLSENIVPVPRVEDARFARMLGFGLVSGTDITFTVQGELPEGLEINESGTIEGILECDPGTYEFTIVAAQCVYSQCRVNPDGSLVALNMGPIHGMMNVTEFGTPVTLIVE